MEYTIKTTDDLLRVLKGIKTNDSLIMNQQLHQTNINLIETTAKVRKSKADVYNISEKKVKIELHSNK